MQPYTQR